MSLSLCSDVSAPGWIVSSDVPWDRLVTFGPAGFEAYARLRFLPDPTSEGQRESDAATADSPPDAVRLRRLLELLAPHTTTPDDGYFCLWDGWGGLHGGAATAVLGSPPGIGAGRAVVDRLVAAADLDVVPADPGVRPPAYR